MHVEAVLVTSMQVAKRTVHDKQNRRTQTRAIYGPNRVRGCARQGHSMQRHAPPSGIGRLLYPNSLVRLPLYLKIKKKLESHEARHYSLVLRYEPIPPVTHQPHEPCCMAKDRLKINIIIITRAEQRGTRRPSASCTHTQHELTQLKQDHAWNMYLLTHLSI
jgi:hypothetical protein